MNSASRPAVDASWKHASLTKRLQKLGATQGDSRTFKYTAMLGKYVIGAALVFTACCISDVVQHLSFATTICDGMLAAAFLQLARVFRNYQIW